MKNRFSFTVIASCLTLLSAGTVLAQAADPAVKKSDSGICHDKTSASYEQTKNFTEFKTVDECIKSGGTLPKK